MGKNDSSGEESQDEKTKPKSLYDIQRKQLEKLMSHPEREVEIPNQRDEDKKPRAFYTHEFVRNVMGASAGAGSGEFDIYRGCRRRENLRQEYLEQQAEKQQAKKEFDEKRMAHIVEAEKKTAKKRAKRLKQKQKLKSKKTGGDKKIKDEEESESNNDDSQEAIDQDEEAEEVIDLDEKEPSQEANKTAEPVVKTETKIEVEKEVPVLKPEIKAVTQ